MKKFLIVLFLLIPVLCFALHPYGAKDPTLDGVNVWTGLNTFDSVYVEVTIIDYIDVALVDCDSLIMGVGHEIMFITGNGGTFAVANTTGDTNVYLAVNGTTVWAAYEDSLYVPIRTSFGSNIYLTQTTGSIYLDTDRDTRIVSGDDSLRFYTNAALSLEIRNLNAAFGVPLNIDRLVFPELTAAGSYVMSNLPANAADGAEVKYFLQIDGNNVFTIEGTADGAGGVDEFSVRILPGAVPTAPDEGQMCITSTGDSLGVYLASGWKWFVAGE